MKSQKYITPPASTPASSSIVLPNTHYRLSSSTDLRSLLDLNTAHVSHEIPENIYITLALLSDILLIQTPSSDSTRWLLEITHSTTKVPALRNSQRWRVSILLECYTSCSIFGPFYQVLSIYDDFFVSRIRDARPESVEPKDLKSLRVTCRSLFRQWPPQT
jgi:hypothetical protein